MSVAGRACAVVDGEAEAVADEAVAADVDGAPPAAGGEL